MITSGNGVARVHGADVLIVATHRVEEALPDSRVLRVLGAIVVGTGIAVVADKRNQNTAATIRVAVVALGAGVAVVAVLFNLETASFARILRVGNERIAAVGDARVRHLRDALLSVILAPVAGLIIVLAAVTRIDGARVGVVAVDSNIDTASVDALVRPQTGFRIENAGALVEVVADQRRVEAFAGVLAAVVVGAGVAIVTIHRVVSALTGSRITLVNGAAVVVVAIQRRMGYAVAVRIIRVARINRTQVIVLEVPQRVLAAVTALPVLHANILGAGVEVVAGHRNVLAVAREHVAKVDGARVAVITNDRFESALLGVRVAEVDGALELVVTRRAVLALSGERHAAVGGAQVIVVAILEFVQAVPFFRTPVAGIKGALVLHRLPLVNVVLAVLGQVEASAVILLVASVGSADIAIAAVLGRIVAERVVRICGVVNAQVVGAGEAVGAVDEVEAEAGGCIAGIGGARVVVVAVHRFVLASGARVAGIDGTQVAVITIHGHVGNLTSVGIAPVDGAGIRVVAGHRSIEATLGKLRVALVNGAGITVVAIHLRIEAFTVDAGIQGAPVFVVADDGRVGDDARFGVTKVVGARVAVVHINFLVDAAAVHLIALVQ